MKTTSKPLNEFISDFRLSRPDGAVCFTGTIYFSSASISIRFTTEIHILNINAKNINLLYLLNPEISGYSIPDMFQDDKESFTYLDKKALLVKGHAGIYGNYVVVIYPLNRGNEGERINEIPMKN